jgi:cytochrome c-type biogenesis protein CcmH/NrfF
VTNIIGFFVEGMSDNDVVGRVVMYPGQFVQGPPNLGNGSSFLQVIRLVR